MLIFRNYVSLREGILLWVLTQPTMPSLQVVIGNMVTTGSVMDEDFSDNYGHCPQHGAFVSENFLGRDKHFNW